MEEEERREREDDFSAFKQGHNKKQSKHTLWSNWTDMMLWLQPRRVNFNSILSAGKNYIHTSISDY